MSHYTVVAGINGAGLMNGIYLPPHGVVIQLVPYEAHVNHVQYGELLKARGPYMIWHNSHKDLHRTIQGDSYNNKPDTILHVGEWKDLIKQALSMAAKEAKKIYRDEL